MAGYHALTQPMEIALESCIWITWVWSISSQSVFPIHVPSSAQNPITEDGIGGVEYLKDGIGQLIKLIDDVVVAHDSWGIIEQTRGGIGPGFLYQNRY